jgi:hypothetical protein
MQSRSGFGSEEFHDHGKDIEESATMTAVLIIHKMSLGISAD